MRADDRICVERSALGRIEIARPNNHEDSAVDTDVGIAAVAVDPSDSIAGIITIAAIAAGRVGVEGGRPDIDCRSADVDASRSAGGAAADAAIAARASATPGALRAVGKTGRARSASAAIATGAARSARPAEAARGVRVD